MSFFLGSLAMGRSAGNWFNHTSWVAVVTQTDLAKSVRNRCVIEVFGGILCSQFPFWGFLSMSGL